MAITTLLYGCNSPFLANNQPAPCGKKQPEVVQGTKCGQRIAHVSKSQSGGILSILSPNPSSCTSFQPITGPQGKQHIMPCPHKDEPSEKGQSGAEKEQPSNNNILAVYASLCIAKVKTHVQGIHSTALGFTVQGCNTC